MVEQPLNSAIFEFLKNGLQNFGHGFNYGISHALHQGLNFMAINNQLKILVAQPRNSDILILCKNCFSKSLHSPEFLLGMSG